MKAAAATIGPMRPGRLLAAAAAAAGALAPGAGSADTRFYVSAGMGGQFAPAVRLVSGDDDRPSLCDQFVNPAFAARPGCTDPDRGAGAVDDWRSRFGGARGLLAGAAFGYRLTGRVRVEAEYLHRTTAYGRTAPILTPSGTPYTAVFGAELPLAQERIGGVAADGLFANVHLDFPNRSRVTPWVGAGAGVAAARIDYSALWARALDPALIDSAAGLPNEAEVRGLLAGTVTSAQAALRDTLPAWQVMAGFDVALSGTVSLGVTGRWTRFGRFGDGGAYDRLRSHVSNVRRDGGEPVAWRVETGDLRFAGVQLSLKYGF